MIFTCAGQVLSYTSGFEKRNALWFIFSVEAEVEKASDEPSKEEDNKSKTNELLKQMEKVDKEILEVEKKICHLEEKQVVFVCCFFINFYTIILY